jgi:hypothetical protein
MRPNPAAGGRHRVANLEDARHRSSRRRADRAGLASLRGRAANPIPTPEGRDAGQRSALDRLSAQSGSLSELSRPC